MVDIVSLLVNAEDHTTFTLAFSVTSQKQNMLYHIVDYLMLLAWLRRESAFFLSLLLLCRLPDWEEPVVGLMLKSKTSVLWFNVHHVHVYKFLQEDLKGHRLGMNELLYSHELHCDVAIVAVAVLLVPLCTSKHYCDQRGHFSCGPLLLIAMFCVSVRIVPTVRVLTIAVLFFFCPAVPAIWLIAVILKDVDFFLTHGLVVYIHNTTTFFSDF